MSSATGRSTATFTLVSHTLTVTGPARAAGTVTSSPAGINCGATCTAQFTHGTMVTLDGHGGGRLELQRLGRRLQRHAAPAR